MELIYLYIEDDGKNIKDCEFNFSPEFRISYNRDRHFISVVRNDNYIPDFWEANNISNITAIVGKNGAGKSNLLEYIFRYYTSSSGLSGESKRNMIHIYRSKGILFINREDIPSNYKLHKAQYIQYPLNNFKNNANTKLVYYSSHYEKDILFELGQGVISEDVSTGGLLRKFGNDRQLLKNPKEFADLDRLIIEDTFRQLDLLVFSRTTFFDDVSLPTSLNIGFKEGANKLESENQLYNRLYIDKPLPKLGFTGYLINRFLYFIFNDKTYVSSLNIEDDEDITANDFIGKTYAGKLYHELIKLFEEGKVTIKKYPHQMGLRKDYPLNFHIKRNDISFDLIIGLYYFYFKNEVSSDPQSLDHVRITYNDLVLSWQGLSAGELEYFNFLSRIYSPIKSVIIDHGKKGKTQWKPDKFLNIILLLDEPENSFHPEWQRLFLNNFIHFLNHTLPFHTFQIIITSHSPIIVSDLPKNNIIFLDKNPDGTCKVVDSISRENTFGANIHTLYRNSFFIDGLPMGEFAKKKINKLFDELENEETIRPSIIKEIQMIGEPIIHDQLMKLYKRREGLPEDVNRRISELEKEISILKERLNDKNRT